MSNLNGASFSPRRIMLPDGSDVIKIIEKKGVNSNQIWETKKFRYVSLGDSIAAGCNITPEVGYSRLGFEFNPVGLNGQAFRDQPTVIIENTYTDRILKDLRSKKYTSDMVEGYSFATSGCTNEALSEYLDFTSQASLSPKEALREADLVTISIGANQILIEAMNYLSNYFLFGDITGFEQSIYQNFQRLSESTTSYKDSAGHEVVPPEDVYNNVISYRYFLDKLTSPKEYTRTLGDGTKRQVSKGINPNATYIFTEIHNPYKYLHLDKGENGFFKGLVSLFENVKFDVNWVAKNIYNVDLDYDLKIPLSGMMKWAFTSEYSPLDRILDRVNSLGEKVENYVNELNRIINHSISDYKNQFGIENIFQADVKKTFDAISDRKDLPLKERYSGGAVSCQYSTGFDYVGSTEWHRMLHGATFEEYWWNFLMTPQYEEPVFDKSQAFNQEYLEQYQEELTRYLFERKYVSFNPGLIGNFGEYLGKVTWNYVIFGQQPTEDTWEDFFKQNEDLMEIHWEALLRDIILTIIMEIIIPDIDPHPRAYGHQALYTAFSDIINERFKANKFPKLTRHKITLKTNEFDVGKVLEVATFGNPGLIKFTTDGLIPPEGHVFSCWRDESGKEVPYQTDANGAVLYYYLDNISGDRTITAEWAALVEIEYYKQCKLSENHLNLLNATKGGVQEEKGPIYNLKKEPYYLSLVLEYKNRRRENIELTDYFSENISGFDGKSPTRTLRVPADTKIYLSMSAQGDAVCTIDSDYDEVQKFSQKYIRNYQYNDGNLPAKTQLVFTWYTDGEYFGITLPTKSYWDCKASDMTQRTYTVTYNANGGNGSMSQSLSYTTGRRPSSCTLTGNQYTKDGYRFVCWTTNKDGTGNRYKNTETLSLLNNVTLYAQWSNQRMIYYRYKYVNSSNWPGWDYVDSEGRVTAPNKYQFWIDGTLIPRLGLGKEDVFSIPLSAPIGVIVGYNENRNEGACSIECDRPYIWDDISKDYIKNKTTKQDGLVRHTFDPAVFRDKDLVITFEWHTTGQQALVSNSTSYENCVIETVDVSECGIDGKYLVSFSSGGGDGFMGNQEVLKVKDFPARALINHGQFKCDKYYPDGWSFGTNSCSPRSIITLTGDTTLTQKWNNKHDIRYYKSNHTSYLSTETGHKDIRSLKVGGRNIQVDGTFNESPKPTNPKQLNDIVRGTSIEIKTEYQPDITDDAEYNIPCDCNIIVKNGDGKTLKQISGQKITYTFEWDLVEELMETKRCTINIDFQAKKTTQWGKLGFMPIIETKEWWDVVITII